MSRCGSVYGSAIGWALQRRLRGPALGVNDLRREKAEETAEKRDFAAELRKPG